MHQHSYMFSLFCVYFELMFVTKKGLPNNNHKNSYKFTP